MKSVILCEGPDDLWFLSYYLYKAHGWNKCNVQKHIWRNYEIVPLNSKQHVNYMRKDHSCVAIWCVAGKDSFEAAVRVIFDKIIQDFPIDPIDSVVLVADRDHDDVESRISDIQTWLPCEANLSNKSTESLQVIVDEQVVNIRLTPVIIPFDQDGAIETLLMSAIKESGEAGEQVVSAACEYVTDLADNKKVKDAYLKHERLLLKATYDATIAITNPGHSTGLFQDMVMACPWEESEHVKQHFDVVEKAIR